MAGPATIFKKISFYKLLCHVFLAIVGNYIK